MRRNMYRLGLAATLVAALLAAGLLAGACTPAEEEPELVALVEPPVIGKAGVLRVAIDLEYPPFGGTDKGQQAGLDVDVAAAIAAELGLELKVVDVPASEITTAMADGDADIVMSIPFDEASMGSLSLAGSYYENGPAFFISTEDTSTEIETLDIATLKGKSVAAQDGSSAFWILEYELGTGGVTTYPTLREALEALDAGEVEVVAGDAFVAAYIARDISSIRFAGQLEPALLHGAATKTDATELEEEIRAALDKLAADGVLGTLRAKWVGDLPVLETAGEQ